MHRKQGWRRKQTKSNNFFLQKLFWALYFCTKYIPKKTHLVARQVLFMMKFVRNLHEFRSSILCFFFLIQKTSENSYFCFILSAQLLSQHPSLAEQQASDSWGWKHQHEPNNHAISCHINNSRDKKLQFCMMRYKYPI